MNKFCLKTPNNPKMCSGKEHAGQPYLMCCVVVKTWPEAQLQNGVMTSSFPGVYNDMTYIAFLNCFTLKPLSNLCAFVSPKRRYWVNERLECKPAFDFRCSAIAVVGTRSAGVTRCAQEPAHTYDKELHDWLDADIRLHGWLDVSTLT